MLTFATPSAEQAFVERRNGQLLGQDVSWALFWTFMVGGGVLKWARSEGPRDNRELAWLIPYFLCCPVLLAIIKLCPRWYVRRRVAVITVLRLTRSFFFLARSHHWEAVYLNTATSALPSTPFAIYEHLSWRPSSHLVAGLGWVTPLKAYLPFQLPFLIANLVAASQRCMAECGATAASAAAAAAGGCSAVASASVAAAAAASTAGDVCLASSGGGGGGGGGPMAARSYYSWLVGWIRRGVPLARHLPQGWRLGAGGCLSSCYAVHGWLQGVTVLLTIALLWAWEERLRCRELKAWRLSQQEQPLLQQQQQQSVAEGSHGGSGSGRIRRQPLAAARRLLAAALPEPLPGGVLAAGWLMGCWGLWLCLELAFL
ncbi:hypothetical protein D9Q98_010295 [Chlorella vulgaris]|uniref:Uncharacterized protein n=1 Tax=Chlorella vulgaris TaxID=3077 RepID=A0A9D4TK28_CHLVU|nr:hypothetical protein D9Q98_010295 [Chlorella vulgaris]